MGRPDEGGQTSLSWNRECERIKKIVRIGSAILGSLFMMSLFAAVLSPGPIVIGGPGTRGLVSTLTSAIASTAPTLDGQGTDAAWSQATQLTITVSGGANTAGDIDVHIKSVYVGGKVYFWTHWADTEDSKDRFPWHFNGGTGKWEQLGDVISGDANSYYEDKLAFIWNIGGSIANFGGATGQGPAVTCHSGEHYTNSASEIGDIWHWKRVRTGPVNQVDDQYMNSSHGAGWGDAGRHSDPKTGGGYSDNNKTLTYEDNPAASAWVPKAWIPGATGDDLYWIKVPDLGVRAYNITKVWTNGTMQDDVGNLIYNTTARIPGILIAPITGDRGNISAGASWSGGSWTLEFGRDLVTGSQYDVQFDSTGAAAKYYFSAATFNNSQIGHGMGYGDVYELVFAQPNQPPSDPTITYAPTNPVAGDTVTFATVSVDPDLDTLSYAWSFGDGATGTGIAPTHAYSSAGAYTVSVTVDDGHGHTKTASVSITVAEKAGISTTMIIIIVIVVVLLAVIMAVALSRRKKQVPPTEPQPPQP